MRFIADLISLPDWSLLYERNIHKLLLAVIIVCDIRALSLKRHTANKIMMW